MLGCHKLRLETLSSARLRMQPYPRSPGHVWPGHLHGMACLSARAMDTGFPTVVWCLCFGLGFAVTPQTLAGVQAVCSWVRGFVLPHHSWLRFVVGAVGLRFWFATRQSWLVFWGVCLCVRALPAPRHSRLRCAVWVCELGLGFRLRPTVPGRSFGWCVLVYRLRLYPATPGWGVWSGCVCLRTGCGCAPPFLAGA